jgi:hypothetical protein
MSAPPASIGKLGTDRKALGCSVSRRFQVCSSGDNLNPEVILLAVGWYLRFSLSYRDVEELLAERGLHADHVTVWRSRPAEMKGCNRVQDCALSGLQTGSIYNAPNASLDDDMRAPK